MRKIKGIVPKDVKAEAWRKISGFDPFNGERFDFDGVVERIAVVYGLSTDDIEAELSVSDILPVYMDCVKFVNDLVFSKLNQMPDGKKKVR